MFARRRALDLPVSQLVLDAGFQDTFRKIHPNPVQHPGITWSPMYRGSIQQRKARHNLLSASTGCTSTSGTTS